MRENEYLSICRIQELMVYNVFFRKRAATFEDLLGLMAAKQFRTIGDQRFE